MRSALTALVVGALLFLSAAGGLKTAHAQAQPAPAGDPARGRTLYEARCGGCHSLDANRVGPLHRGVVGRRAASVPNYNYSQALRASSLTWTEANLDRWLSGPTRLVPGTRMGLSVALPADRRDIIAYLRTEGAAGAAQ